MRKIWLAGVLALTLAGGLVGAVVMYRSLRSALPQDDVLAVARSLDAGGYLMEGAGVPQPVVFKGTTVAATKPGGSYCCGFTFWAAMRVAEQRGLLAGKSVSAVRQFRRECYGATKGSAERQMTVAMEGLGIGRGVDPNDAVPGDFVSFWRTTGIGHSVVFLEYIRHDDVIVGLRYRSSQEATNGVGDRIEYFFTSGYAGATIDPKRFYVCRLNRH